MGAPSSRWPAMRWAWARRPCKLNTLRIAWACLSSGSRSSMGIRDLPSGTVAGGSSQSASIIAAVNAAQREAHQGAARARRQGFSAGRLKPGRSGGARCRASSREGRDALRELRRDPASALARRSSHARQRRPMPTEVQKYSMHSYGAQFCEVRVNAVTGEMRVSRWLGSFDTRPHPQSKDGGQPVPGRHHHGDLAWR